MAQGRDDRVPAQASAGRSFIVILLLYCSFIQARINTVIWEVWADTMADRERRRFIPSKTTRGRTLVLIALIAVVAIAIIVVALSLATSPPEGDGDQTAGRYVPPPTVSSNGTAGGIRVDSFSIEQNTSSGVSTFFVTVTNTLGSEVTRDLNVLVTQVPGVSAPNRPYSNSDPPLSNPTIAGTQNITLAAGETKTVPVSVNTPPGFSIQPGNVLITLT